MKATNDPILKAFENMDDRTTVDQVIVDTYGKPVAKKKKSKKKK